ncbi:intracellular protease/amidase [Rhizobium sp. CCGE 510]|nr:intracellular protease/amidase [Rhizobium sp. CCGE 510]
MGSLIEETLAAGKPLALCHAPGLLTKVKAPG